MAWDCHNVPDLLGRVVLFTPKLLIAMLIMVFGAYCAGLVGNAVQNYCAEARIADADVLGRLVRYAIMLFVVMIALSRSKSGGDIVQRTFLIILAGLCRYRLGLGSAARIGPPRCQRCGRTPQDN